MRLFGQEVQVPEQQGQGGRGGTAGASRQQQQQGGGGSGMVDALQFVKYFHLVPAAGLRSAFEAAHKAAAGNAGNKPSFEALLLSAEAAGDHRQPSQQQQQPRGAAAGAAGPAASGGKGGGKAPHLPRPRLLRRPQVMALGIVWESPQVRHTV